jgi:nicotinamide riboside transporter PnuC
LALVKYGSYPTVWEALSLVTSITSRSITTRPYVERWSEE